MKTEYIGHSEKSEWTKNDYYMLSVGQPKGPGTAYELTFETSNVELLKLVDKACCALLGAFRMPNK